MNEDKLYYVDSLALNAAIGKRGLDFNLISRYSGVHENTIKRLAGVRIPKGMPKERERLAHGPVITKLAGALRVKPRTFAPDLPEYTRPSAPTKPTEQGKPAHKVPGDWRQKEDSVRRRRRLAQIAEDE